MQDDDDLLPDRKPEELKRTRPALRSWSADAELRATLYDVAGLIQTAIVAVNTPKGKQAPKFRPTKRPETAVDRAERRWAVEMHAEIVGMVLPER